uniref:Thrombospondin n=1 Tax=uncultured marine virus TaxID=186617 RepID=A0A0F7LAB0_9VIRU|nr:thrombospondin [uncultured marine virus]
MTRIRLETGQIINFEGTPSQGDIDEVVRSIGDTAPQPTQQETQSKSFFRPKQLSSSVGRSLKDPFQSAAGDIQSAVSRQSRGEQGVGRTALTAVGQGSQAGIESVFGAGLDLISAIVPDFIEDPVRRNVGNQINKFAQTEAGLSLLEAARGIEGRINEFSPENQQAIRDVFDLALTGVDIGTAGVAKGAVKRGLKETAQRAGEKGSRLIDEAVDTTEENIRDNFAKLIVDESTPTKRTALSGRTKEGGFFTGREVGLTDGEQKIVDELLKVEGLNPKRSALFNKNILDEQIGSEAKLLKQQLTEDNFIFPKAEVKKRLDDSLEILKKESPDVIGDSEKLADRLFAKAKVFIDAEEGTGLGGLIARQKYDAWVKSKKPKAFEKQDAFNTINREARRVMNDFLAEKAPSAPVKESLEKQSRLLSASDTLATKSGKEAGTGFVRLLDKSTEVLGTKNKVVQLLAAAVGIGGLGAAATFAPVAAGVGGAAATAVLTKKALTSPSAKKKLGKVLLEIEKQLPKADDATRTILLEIQEGIRPLVGDGD